MIQIGIRCIKSIPKKCDNRGIDGRLYEEVFQLKKKKFWFCEPFQKFFFSRDFPILIDIDSYSNRNWHLSNWETYERFNVIPGGTCVCDDSSVFSKVPRDPLNHFPGNANLFIKERK